MLKRRIFTMFTVALLLGLGAAWMADGWIQARLQPAEASTGTSVVVAALEIPFGTKIESTQIRLAEWPVGSLPQAEPAQIGHGDRRDVFGVDL